MRELCLLFLACIPFLANAQHPVDKKWGFKNLDGWVYCHQDDNPERQCSVEKGKLKIFTRAGSADRKKMRTADKIYTTGRYTWRAYISDIAEGDQTSIGCWLYCDDKHEIDFETGPGKSDVREQVGALPGDMIVYMTTQGNPYNTKFVAIKPGWHIFELDLTSVDGKYKVDWIIDGEILSSVQQSFGPEVAFYIYCSVENLKFLGEHPATQDNYGLFDYVKYEYHE